MTELVEIQEKIQATTEAISRLERQMAAQPARPSLLANMKSLQNRYTALEADFAAAAARQGIDICSYRIFAEGARLTLNGVAKALINFQSLVAQVYDSLKRGPRRKGHLSDEAGRGGDGEGAKGRTMSVATLEKEIVLEAKASLKRPKLRLKDLMEWSISEEPVKKNARDTEIVVYLPTVKIWAAFLK